MCGAVRTDTPGGNDPALSGGRPGGGRDLSERLYHQQHAEKTHSQYLQKAGHP